MKTGFVFMLALLFSIALVGCGGNGEVVISETPTQESVFEAPPATSLAVHGPVVVIRPQSDGPAGIAVQGDGNFGLGSSLQDTESQAKGIPGGIILPSRIHIYEMTGGNIKDYFLLIGEQSLPSERIVEMSLTTEIRVGPLEEGTTQLLLVQR